MEIKIDQKIVGDNHPCFVIAEIGSNHNQDFDLAIELIDAAAESNDHHGQDLQYLVAKLYFMSSKINFKQGELAAPFIKIQ